jgi:hypothetical protein
MWVDNWCLNTEEKELKDINEFAHRTKIHQKFKEGDFFRFRINRRLFGYGRILVDYAQMRKDGIQFWDVFTFQPKMKILRSKINLTSSLFTITSNLAKSPS